MPLASFPEICKGLLFRSILRMCIQNLKFVALSVPEIIEAYVSVRSYSHNYWLCSKSTSDQCAESHPLAYIGLVSSDGPCLFLKSTIYPYFWL